MAENFPFPRWEIYYVLIVFPGLVTSSAQIFLMEGVHCRLAGLAGLSFTGAILIAMFLFMLVIVRPSSARRRMVFDESRRGWLLAPPQRSKVTRDDIEEDADKVLIGVVVRMTDWKVHDALDLLVHEVRSRAQKFSDLVDTLDANGDGWISKDEMKSGLFQLDLKLDAYTVDMAMRAFDADGDGHVDRTEFEYCMQEYEAVLEMRALQHALRKQNDLRTGQHVASLFSWSAWTHRLLGEKSDRPHIEPAATVFEVGDRVHHPTRGDGTVAKISSLAAKPLTIAYDSGEVHSYSDASAMKLDITAVQPRTWLSRLRNPDPPARRHKLKSCLHGRGSGKGLHKSRNAPQTSNKKVLGSSKSSSLPSDQQRTRAVLGALVVRLEDSEVEAALERCVCMRACAREGLCACACPVSLSATCASVCVRERAHARAG
jgi:hypothetical protein